MPVPIFHEVPQIVDFLKLPKEKVMKLGTEKAYLLLRIIEIFSKLNPSESAFTSMQENVELSITCFALASMPRNDIKKIKKVLVKKETLTPEQLEKLNDDLVQAKDAYKSINERGCLFLVKLQEMFRTYTHTYSNGIPDLD